MRTYSQAAVKAAPAKPKAIGVALHYFDGEAGARNAREAKSDKFYRIYVYQSGTFYAVTSHWGRDGAISGQTKTETFSTHSAALRYMRKLSESKIKKGYEYLGEASVDFDANKLKQVGENLLATTGRQPSKESPFRLIEEEPDLLEALMG